MLRGEITDNSTKAKVSIALCTYNGAKYLPSQLESYLAQTYPPDEVTVCDDCSKDETVAILNDFAGRSPFPVRVLVNEQNIGSTKNFEKVISQCSGDIIFLCDQDDVWAPNKIERVINEFDRDHEVSMVFSDAEIVDESLQPLGRNLSETTGLTLERREIVKRGNLFSILLKGNIVAGATLAFRAEYNKAIIPIPTDIPDMIHDGWIAIVLSMTAKCVFLNEPLVKYRQHAEQQLGADPREFAQRAIKLSRINIMERMEKKHKTKKAYVESIKSHVISRLDVSDHILNAVNAEIDYHREYVRHYQLRKAMLSGKRVMRLWPIIRELLSGRYHRCSNGVRTAARDFVVDHAREIEYSELLYKGKAVID